MSMSDHLKQQVLQEFCQKGPIPLENSKTGFFCFTRVGKPAHISKLSHLFGVKAAWHTFNPLQNVQYKTLKTGSNSGQRFISSCNQSVFNFFSIGSACSRSLLSFANIYYFMWLASFDLILL